MNTLIIYVLLTTAIYYLMSRALITKFLWSRYPNILDQYFLCAACSGFLYGGAVALAIGWTQDLPFLGLPGQFWVTPIIVGLCSMVWTPILGRLHVRSMIKLDEGEAPSFDIRETEESEANPLRVVPLTPNESEDNESKDVESKETEAKEIESRDAENPSAEEAK